MKHNIIYLAFLLISLFMASCEKFLEEEPKSLLTAQYLESPDGVMAALNSAYSDLRYIYGNEPGMMTTCSGTDEWQAGPGGSSPYFNYSSTMASVNTISGIWNWGYTDINTCNAVITFAPTSGMQPSEAAQVVAEAKYIRATWHFIILQTWGDCPLNLEFLTEPTTEATRTPASDVYASIIDDLTEAKNNLPAVAEMPGQVDAAAATHLLAKVYLTKATHATAGESSDYQNAYNNAIELINNAGEYGLALLDDFEQVFEPGNEQNTEVLFTVERNTDILYNDAGNPSGQGSSQKNSIAYMLFNPNYPTWVAGLIRDIPYGRPWHRVRPTNYLLDNAFAANNRVNDRRYDKTFRTVWLVNDPDNVEDPSFGEGDTAAWLPGIENYDASVKSLVIYPPSQYYGENGQTASIYPAMKKFHDVDRPDMNESAVRPFIVHRFAETYLIAAEAAMYLGNAIEAVNLLNVVRDRASYDPDRSAAENATALQNLRNQVPGMTDIDAGITFILDERSRELCGEYMRWWDLVRTRTGTGEVQLLNRVKNANIPNVSTEIKDFHVLRPIPQSQLDLTTNEDFVNNPGYN